MKQKRKLVMIGKYVQSEAVPSIEVAAKIAATLGVRLDYLVKDGKYEQADNNTSNA